MDHSCDEEEIFEGLEEAGREFLFERYGHMKSLKENDTFYYVPLLAWDLYKGSNKWVCLMALEEINVKTGRKSKPKIRLYQWFNKSGVWKGKPWAIRLEYEIKDKVI